MDAEDEGAFHQRDGIEDGGAKAGGVEAGDAVGEKAAHVGDDIVVDGILLHGLGGALNVHHDVRDAGGGDEIEHAVVQSAALHIDHVERKQCTENNFPPCQKRCQILWHA